MSNKINQEMNKIKIPRELRERSKMGVYQAKKEMKKDRRGFPLKSFGIAAVLLAAGSFFLFINGPFDKPNQGEQSVMEDGSVTIPSIQLPKDGSNADMIGLIVYNGKIYTQSKTEIDAEDAKLLIGEKLGMTKGSIDEWSTEEAYDEELASTIGETDVYSVKGYDKEFRIMTYQEINGEQYAEFYENLNGITIKNGQDVFGKLNINNNVASVEYRVFSDWDYSIDNYHPVTDLEAVNMFLDELNRAIPISRGLNSDPISEYRSDENFRELTIHLQDGSKVKLTLLKDGYIYYGFMGAYFEMEEEIFSTFWSQID